MPTITILSDSTFPDNNGCVTNNQQPVNAAFENAVRDLYARLRETVTCPLGCAGAAWAHYHAGVSEYGIAAAMEALNRFARSQNEAA